MHKESRFNSTADNGLGYYGLCQWGGERKDNLFKWCEENGYSVKDGYRDFINEIIESQDSYWDNYQEFGNNI